MNLKLEKQIKRSFSFLCSMGTLALSGFSPIFSDIPEAELFFLYYCLWKKIIKFFGEAFPFKQQFFFSKEIFFAKTFNNCSSNRFLSLLHKNDPLVPRAFLSSHVDSNCRIGLISIMFIMLI